jgi:hypothetical protein
MCQTDDIITNFQKTVEIGVKVLTPVAEMKADLTLPKHGTADMMATGFGFD